MRSPYLAPTGASASTKAALRQALGQFATGVTVVTALDSAGQPVGLTVNSFASVSLDPALVLWSLQANSRYTAHFGVGQAFAVNVLGQHQADLSQRFASSTGSKFADTPYTVSPAGFVHLSGALATFDCEAQSAQTAGDHILYIARVLRYNTSDSAGSPLLFFNGHYGRLSAE